jgi:hypothetical protein
MGRTEVARAVALVLDEERTPSLSDVKAPDGSNRLGILTNGSIFLKEEGLNAPLRRDGCHHPHFGACG